MGYRLGPTPWDENLEHEPYNNDELAARREGHTSLVISRSGQRWLLSVPLLVGLCLIVWQTTSEVSQDSLVMLGAFLCVPWIVSWL